MQKNTIPTAVLTLFLFLLLTPQTMLAEELDFPESGSDVSNLRCPDGLVSIGDAERDVVTRCGDPIKRGWLPGRTYDISVYHFEGGAFIYYLGYRSRSVERIYSVKCSKDSPLCQ